MISRQKQRIVRGNTARLLECPLTKFSATPAPVAAPRAAPQPCATPWMTTRTTWCSSSPGPPGASHQWATSRPWAGGRAPSPRLCPGPSPTPSIRSVAETEAEAPLPRKKEFSLVTCLSPSRPRSRAPEPEVHCRVPRATVAWARWSLPPDTRSVGESRVTCHECRNPVTLSPHSVYRVHQADQGGYSLDYVLKELSDDELSSSSR